jgi:hypothetical protein
VPSSFQDMSRTSADGQSPGSLILMPPDRRRQGPGAGLRPDDLPRDRMEGKLR